MKMPVPSDWDGESTCDFQVTWPDSAIWRFILRGLLTNPGLSEFWDASTGDVQQVILDFQPIMTDALNNLECGAMQIPIGTVLEFAGSTLPDKFLWADGSLVAIGDYPDLFGVIGYIFGDNLPEVENHFYLPDRRERVAVGVNPGGDDFDEIGVTGGEKRHTLTISEIPSHIHGAFNYVGSGGSHNWTISGGGNNAASLTSNSTGGGGSHNNLQPYITMGFIIRAEK